MQEALIHNNADIADLLVKSGAKSNFFSDAASGNLEAVRAKIWADPTIVHRPDGWGRPPLAYAAASGQAEIVKLLLAFGAQDLPPDRFHFGEEHSAIAWAVRAKNVQMIRLLCETGSDPNLLDEAIIEGSADVVGELLAHKADPERPDIHGYRPLQNAAVFDRLDIVQLLLYGGVDPNAPTGIDEAPCGSLSSTLDTALHLAASLGSAKVVSELIQHGAKLNVLNTKGWTPLHAAASSDEAPAKALDAVKLLIDAGADVNAKDAEGQTPLDDAIKASRTADKPDPVVVDFLRAHRGKAGSAVPGPNAVPPEAPGDSTFILNPRKSGSRPSN